MGVREGSMGIQGYLSFILFLELVVVRWVFGYIFLPMISFNQKVV